MEWKLCYAHEAACAGRSFETVAQLLEAGYDCIPASVPGNFELDLAAAGRAPEWYPADNVLRAQALEDVHVWYFTRFTADARLAADGYVHFGGVDTVADIYLNGCLALHTENMFLEHDLPAALREGPNELLVHLYPAVLHTRDRPLPAACSALSYQLESLYLRKAPYMYGWDIMPRIVSCGLWRPVELRTRLREGWDDVFLYTLKAEPDRQDMARGSALLGLHANWHTPRPSLEGCEWRLELCAGEERHVFSGPLLHTTLSERLPLTDCRLWWPRPLGRPHLYEAVLTLACGGRVLDSRRFAFGVRTVALHTAQALPLGAPADAGGAGQAAADAPDGMEDGTKRFCFFINGRRVFILGTNWVPLDAFPARTPQRLPLALELLRDSGCNMVRCWGGAGYGPDELYDFCDEQGILIWQDLAMACAVYPPEESFYAQMRAEVEAVAKRLRNHASLALWAGDNEGDMTYVFWQGLLRDPSHCALTRSVIPQVLAAHDFTRPYLPSSPWVTRPQQVSGPAADLAEDHLWGPRDYFKGPYYTGSTAAFASETGYHGCPSPASLRRFLPPEHLWPILDDAGTPDVMWLVHAACMRPQPQAPYAYRIPLMVSQVGALFTRTGDTLDTFARQSQISQAEAKKFFIERFRMGQWQRTGIIWWNLLDGWPQISDAVVDYYGTPKLAYSFIRRSQQPVCLMLSEPDAASLYTLYGVNDLTAAAPLHFTVRDVTANALLHEEEAVLPAQSAQPLCSLCAPAHHMLQFCWQGPQGTGSNHAYTALREVVLEDYLRDLARCGYDCFAGFDEPQ